MDEFERAVRDHTRKLTHDWLRDLIERKLREQGVEPEKAMVQALLEHALADRLDQFEWESDGDEDRRLELTVTAEDRAEFEAFSGQLRSAVPATVSEVSAKMAKRVFRDLKAKWADQNAGEFAHHESFKLVLDAQWGEGLGYLRMLHTVSLEIGEEAWKRHRRSKTKKPTNLRSLLIRMHARACQILGEIITLLENGFPDGALARWRTLHELTVVALVIEEHGEPIAARYIDHEVVEAKRALELYSRSAAEHGQSPPKRRDARATMEAYAAALEKYGEDFKLEYGWAAPFIKGNLNFVALEKAAGRAALRSHYKAASYSVHAGMKGLTFRLGLLDDSVVLAGASNAGLCEPGKHAALAIVQLDLILLGLERGRQFQRLVMQRAVILIKDAVVRALQKADRDQRQWEAPRLTPSWSLLRNDSK